MKLTIELTTRRGLRLYGTVSAPVLRALLPLLAGAMAWPWLTQLVQGLGWG